MPSAITIVELRTDKSQHYPYPLFELTHGDKHAGVDYYNGMVKMEFRESGRQHLPASITRSMAASLFRSVRNQPTYNVSVWLDAHKVW